MLPLVRPFINIHTHRLCNSNELCIRNILPEKWDDNLSKTGSLFSVGLHPWFLESAENVDSELDVVKSLITHPEFIAIGEAGLDKVSQTVWDLQVLAFKKQISLSEQSGKPMIIHCVKSYNEILVIRKDMKAFQPWIFHGFNSSTEMAHQIIEAGCLLSFGKMILKSRSKAINVFKGLQSGQFFLETDDDDINIENVYQDVAELRNTTIEELKNQQLKNFRNLFGEVSLPI